MFAKLTLNISQSVIEKAKKTARGKKTSLSRLVENYLAKISEDKGESVVSSIIKNAPANKTKPGTEKKILKKALSHKYVS
jgi:hypothetical protein